MDKPNRPVTPPKRPAGSKPPSPQEQIEAERRRKAELAVAMKEAHREADLKSLTALRKAYDDIR